MTEFDFSSLLETTKEKTLQKNRRGIVQDRGPVKPEKSSISETRPSKKDRKGQIVFDSLDSEDVEILSILASKFKQQGITVVGHNRRNPFVQDLVRLAFFVQHLESFKAMYKEGLLIKTKYATQWRIR